MFKTIIGFIIFIGGFNITNAAPWQIGSRMLPDTIVIDPNLLEGDSNLSVLPLNKGLYKIGDTVVNLAAFEMLDTAFQWENISFKPGITSFMRLNYRQYDEPGKKDSVLLWGKAIKAKGKALNHEYNYSLHEPSGFPNRCPPGVCSYYYLTKNKKGKVFAIKDPQTLKEIIAIRKPTDALFMLDDQLHFAGKYCKTSTGYMVLVNKVITHCTIQYADILYFINNEGVVTEKGRVLTWMTRLCY